MSETASTIVKLLSTLTSPKACIKYIAVAIFITLSWKHLSELLLKLGAPEEHIDIVILLFGVGLGSLIGQLLAFIGSLLWSHFQSIREAIKAKKARSLALAEKKAKDEAANRILIKKYIRSFPHFNWDQKVKLRELTLRELTLDMSSQPYKALLENGYIERVSHITNTEYLVKLNPLLNLYTKQNWSEEIREHVGEFFEEMTPEKHRVLALLKYREDADEDDSEINFDLKSVVSPHYSCLRVEAEDKNGFWLCFQSHYMPEFETRANMQFLDEVWINNKRLKFVSDVDQSGQA